MKIRVLLSILLFALFAISCKSKPAVEKGNLRFLANGEGFVANGFTDKTGWKIEFTKVIVNLTDISVLSKDGAITVNLPGVFPTDLKKGADATVSVGEVQNVNATEYRRLKWSVKRMTEGEYNGYSMVLMGTAVKAGKKITFTIKLDEEVTWDAKDGYSGEKVKGIVKKGQTGEVEMTFHWDHVFGDKSQALTHHVNKGAVGFDFFARFAKNNVVDINQQELKEKGKDLYKMLIVSIHNMGHSGEGHAAVVSSTTPVSAQ